jgi:hypothetical protein
MGSEGLQSQVRQVCGGLLEEILSEFGRLLMTHRMPLKLNDWYVTSEDLSHRRMQTQSPQ